MTDHFTTDLSLRGGKERQSANGADCAEADLDIECCLLVGALERSQGQFRHR